LDSGCRRQRFLRWGRVAERAPHVLLRYLCLSTIVSSLKKTTLKSRSKTVLCELKGSLVYVRSSRARQNYIERPCLKQSTTKQNKTKQNKTKQNKTKLKKERLGDGLLGTVLAAQRPSPSIHVRSQTLDTLINPNLEVGDRDRTA